MKVYLKHNPTARELIEAVAGERHRLHSVANAKRLNGATMQITCSCGDAFSVAYDEHVKHALKNVPIGVAS